MTTPMKTPVSLQSRTYPTRPAQPENPPAQQSASNSDSLQKRYAPPPAQLPTESAPVVAPNPPTPKVEVEVDPIDSYFTSDDDAFLAAFDLDAIDKDANEKVNAEMAKASAGSSAVALQSGSSHAGGGFNGATASGRSATAANNQAPSAGGVRFPAGMPVNSSSNSRQNLTSFVGTKRPAEAMQEAAKRPSYSGMGYAQQQQPQQQANNGRREPLSSLQVGEGGDVKRVKR
ncbi:hypothetical protein BV25DRAFT_1820007 [Artomyces pyxidatus]|uniref:Uncharacterized protein n=1 Tax=Artomyces pyxidatus TaxID=48021 RepID=A0ACB8TEQ0_9AGAM|nr:hypothetical protein BV25DRAFT_1820007 [Artomyces pyxidatus]